MPPASAYMPLPLVYCLPDRLCPNVYCTIHSSRLLHLYRLPIVPMKLRHKWKPPDAISHSWTPVDSSTVLLLPYNKLQDQVLVLFFLHKFVCYGHHCFHGIIDSFVFSLAFLNYRAIPNGCYGRFLVWNRGITWTPPNNLLHPNIFLKVFIKQGFMVQSTQQPNLFLSFFFILFNWSNHSLFPILLEILYWLCVTWLTFKYFELLNWHFSILC